MTPRALPAAAVLVLLPVAAAAQTEREPRIEREGPATLELRAIESAERAGAGRSPARRTTTAQARAAAAQDRERLDRVAELLARGKLTTQEDFDIAARIFLHGDTPEDLLTAHELSIIAGILGVSEWSPRPGMAPLVTNLPARSEDRFLEAIGRRPRFGDRAGVGRHGTVDAGPTAVSPGLRADYLVPSLAGGDEPAARMSMLAEADMKRGFARRLQRLDPRWQAQAARRPVSAELAQLAASGSRSGSHSAAPARVLAIYRGDSLSTADDYYHAARVLARLGDPDIAILAHDLAVVAALWGKAEARPLVAETLDQFLVSIGRPQRYGTVAGRPTGAPAAETVSAHFGLAGRRPAPP